MDVDVLISGHTHTYVSCDLNPYSRGRRLLTGGRDCPSRFQAVEYDGRFFVNPGSATGAWTGLWSGYVSHGGLMRIGGMRATLTRIPQGANAFVRSNGHSRPSGRHVRISVD